MLYFDAETYNESVPIKHGTYKYVSTCEPLIVTYAFDDQPVQVWDCTRQGTMPGDLDYALHDDGELICAHSSMFDRNVLKYAHGINIPIHRWRDTMVKALAHGLPGGLDKLCVILNVPEELAKHQGKQLINLFTKPRGAHVKIRRATRETHPKEWQDFKQFAINDTAEMRYIDQKVPSWNYTGVELAVWHLDQTINDRGFAVDTTLATAAIQAVSSELKNLADKTNTLTRGEVASTTQRDKLLEHILAEYGVSLPDMQMATLERRIADPDLPIELRELLMIRLQATTTSTSKYKTLLNATMPDGRLRGSLQFDGAQRTGRWAGRGFQPQNMPRPDMSIAEINEGIDAIKVGYIDLDAMAKNSIDMLVATEPEVWQEASEFWTWVNEKKRPTFGLDRETFMVCDSFKRLWRRNHPNIVRIWQDLEDYVTLAIDQPGKTFQCRVLKIRRDGAWLRIQLPSGRSLCYPSPQVIDKKITYMGINQYSHQWRRIATYGGRVFENVCQAVARDVMAANMPAIEAAGYEILFTSHDEPITEAPDTDEFTAERLSALLATVPVWAEGMPLAAGGFETYRYRKE